MYYEGKLPWRCTEKVFFKCLGVLCYYYDPGWDFGDNLSQ